MFGGLLVCIAKVGVGCLLVVAVHCLYIHMICFVLDSFLPSTSNSVETILVDVVVDAFVWFLQWQTMVFNFYLYT